MGCKSIPCGALAQLGERLICIQEVIGSIPIGSTRFDCIIKHMTMCLIVQSDGTSKSPARMTDTKIDIV